MPKLPAHTARPVGLLLAAIVLAAATRPAPSYFDGIPNVTITYYDVAGSDAREVRTSLESRGLVDPHDGRIVDATTAWHIGWRWREGASGCEFDAPPSFQAKVTLPRLADDGRLPPETVSRWARYAAALQAHEADHARYAYDHVRDVEKALHARSCADGNAAGHAAIRAIAAHDLALDRATRHGQLRGATFP